MNSRKRIQDTLNHKQPDKIPIDIGGTMCSGMHITCVSALRDYYMLDKHPVKLIEPYQMLGEIEEDLKEVIGIDTSGINGRNTLFGFPNENWKEWRLENGLEVLVPEKFITTTDAQGNTYIYPGGDVSVPPSGKLPKGGYYFDTIIRQEEIDEDNLNPDDNLEEFEPISDEDIVHFKRTVETEAKAGRSLIANFGGTGLGDIALVPAPFLKYPKGIRDVEEWYVSTVMRQKYVHVVFEKQTYIALENLKKLNEAVGEYIDVVFVCGTDFGTQIGTFCSKDTFMELYMPYYKKINGWIHSNTAWKTLKHSCGAIEGFIPLFIEAEFDIINPVQCSAVGMEAEHIKKKFGDQIVFWGGGVDTQKTLPLGTPVEVRKQVLSRCEVFSKDGGFVFNAIHNIQAKTPIENIAAMFSAVHEFNGNK